MIPFLITIVVFVILLQAGMNVISNYRWKKFSEEHRRYMKSKGFK